MRIFPVLSVKNADAGRAFSIGGFALGLLFWIPAFVFYHESTRATGVITGLVKLHEKDQDALVAPQFKYADASGDSHIVTSSYFISSSIYQLGQEVPVRYLRDRPSDARIDSIVSVWGVPIAIQTASVLVFVYCTGALHHLRRRSKSAIAPTG